MNESRYLEWTEWVEVITAPESSGYAPVTEEKERGKWSVDLKDVVAIVKITDGVKLATNAGPIPFLTYDMEKQGLTFDSLVEKWKAVK
jgi:hypothetical protein